MAEDADHLYDMDGGYFVCVKYFGIVPGFGLNPYRDFFKKTKIIINIRNRPFFIL